MSKKDKIFFVILLFLPIISSVLSTIHIISLTTLGNPFGMAIAVAITFEIGSLVSFLLSGGTILKRDTSKAWLYFIFILLFALQALGNVYSGFSYMTKQLISDSTYLDIFKEMCFNAFTVTETKWILAASIGLPLPIISLIMLKFALDKSTIDDTIDNVSNDSEELNESNVVEDDKIKQYINEYSKEDVDTVDLDNNDTNTDVDIKDNSVNVSSDVEKEDEEYKFDGVEKQQQPTSQKKLQIKSVGIKNRQQKGFNNK